MKFERDLANHPWHEIFANETPDKQAETFHNFLRSKLDQYFPEKTVKISTLNKKWFSPSLKQLHRRMQRAYHTNQNGVKFKKLKLKFKKQKRNAITSFFKEFVSNLKSIYISNIYSTENYNTKDSFILNLGLGYIIDIYIRLMLDSYHTHNISWITGNLFNCF